MSEAERLEIPDETAEAVESQETEAASAPEAEPELEAAAAVEISGPPEGGALPEAEAAEAESAAHGLSGATLEAMSRTDPQSVAEAEAERTKWERRREEVRRRLAHWYKLYMADGGFKLGISLVTAIIAAMVIVIAGIFSDRQLGVVFWRAVIGFFVSGLFMGGILYWLDRIGIPLFIAKNEEQIQMEWLSEAEEPEGELGEEAAAEGEEAEAEEMEELMPQEGEEPQTEVEAAEHPEEETAAEEGAAAETSEETQAAEPENGEQAGGGETEKPGEDMGGLENAVLDDAFAPGEAEEEENAEPPTFAPMTADNLETISVPES